MVVMRAELLILLAEEAEEVLEANSLNFSRSNSMTHLASEIGFYLILPFALLNWRGASHANGSYPTFD